MAYPDTNLASGSVDLPFGGQDASTGGTPMQSFRDAQMLAVQTQIVASNFWKPYLTVRMKIASGCDPGDCVMELLTSTETDYTIVKMTAGAYVDPDNTPFRGVAILGCSAGATTPVAIFGSVGIPRSVTGLGIGSKGYLTYDTTSGKLRAAVLGEPVVGTYNTRGYASLGPSL